MTNPYSPPQSTANENGNAPPIPVPIIGLIIGLFALCVTVFFLYRIYNLHQRYPGLVDPSPNVDGYLPEIVAAMFYVVAGISGVVSILTFVYSLFSIRSRRQDKENSP